MNEALKFVRAQRSPLASAVDRLIKTDNVCERIRTDAPITYEPVEESHDRLPGAQPVTGDRCVAQARAGTLMRNGSDNVTSGRARWRSRWRTLWQRRRAFTGALANDPRTLSGLALAVRLLPPPLVAASLLTAAIARRRQSATLSTSRPTALITAVPVAAIAAAADRCKASTVVAAELSVAVFDRPAEIPAGQAAPKRADSTCLCDEGFR